MARRAKMPKGIRAGLQQAAALGNQMSREARADYAIALNANAAGVANLRAQLNRSGAFMADQLAAPQRRLARADVKADQNAASTAQQQAATVNQYGGALAGSAKQAFNVAGVIDAGAQKVAGRAALQGRQQTQIGQNILAIAQTGATAQQAAAEYGLSQALAAREIVANETVAQLQGDLYKMAIQYNQEWSMWKRQQDYAKKLAEEEDKTGIKGLKNDVGRLIDEGGSIAVGAADAWREWRDEYATMDPSDENYVPFNITEAMANWAQTNGYDPAGPEAAVFAATLREIKTNGVNTDVAWATAMNQLYSGMPQWDRWGPAAVLSGQSLIRTGALSTALAAYLARKNPDEAPEANAPAGGSSTGTLPIAGKGFNPYA